MKVYPNPFKPTHIHAKETPLEWKLYSVDVTLVKQGNDPIINATELYSGTYILQVGSKNMKVVKQ